MRGTVKGAIVGSICSMLVLLAASALAGTGVGDVFNLGEPNSVDATSKLSGKTKGPQLHVSTATPSAAVSVAERCHSVATRAQALIAPKTKPRV
jgi:hypothetical protein